MRRAVKQYDGHHNEYAYLPLHLCEQEGLLLAGTLISVPLFFFFFGETPTLSDYVVLQWVRTATPVCGAFKTAISSGQSPPLTLQERTPSRTWSSPHSWGAAEDCPASSWPSAMTSITTLMVTIGARRHPRHKAELPLKHTHSPFVSPQSCSTILN